MDAVAAPPRCMRLTRAETNPTLPSPPCPLSRPNLQPPNKAIHSLCHMSNRIIYGWIQLEECHLGRHSWLLSFFFFFFFFFFSLWFHQIPSQVFLGLGAKALKGDFCSQVSSIYSGTLAALLYSAANKTCRAALQGGRGCKHLRSRTSSPH